MKQRRKRGQNCLWGGWRRNVWEGTVTLRRETLSRVETRQGVRVAIVAEKSVKTDGAKGDKEDEYVRKG